VIGERQQLLLVDGDAEAGNSAKVDSWSIGYENGRVHFGALISRTETSELRFSSVKFQSVWRHPVTNFVYKPVGRLVRSLFACS